MSCSYGKPHKLHRRWEVHRRKISPTGCEILPETITRRTKSPFTPTATFIQLRFDVNIYLFSLPHLSLTPSTPDARWRGPLSLLSCGSLPTTPSAESLARKEEPREDDIGRKSVSTVPYFPFKACCHCTFVRILAASGANLAWYSRHQIASLLYNFFLLFGSTSLYHFSFYLCDYSVPFVVLVYFCTILSSYTAKCLARAYFMQREERVASG